MRFSTFGKSIIFYPVKKIEAVIRPHMLDPVQEALKENVKGMTVYEAKGYGRQRGHTEIYRGSEYQIHFVPKVMITIVCEDDEVDNLVRIIQDTARTGKMGDGKVFISNIENAVRLRTDERGEGAI